MIRSILKQAFVPEGTTSLESLGVDGSTSKEREYEIYGRVDDLSVLAEKASRKEYQEQWGIPCGGEGGPVGTIRVRMTRIDDGEPEYTQTIKVKNPTDNDENEMSITEDTFKLFCKLVPRGLLKTRYVFPVRDTEFELEVDVFHDADGNQNNVVKIDLEVPEGQDINSITMPFKLEEPRLIQPGIKSQEDLDYVRDLFSNQFEVKNPLFVSKKEEPTEEPAAPEAGTEPADAADDPEAVDNPATEVPPEEEPEDANKPVPADNAASIA